MISARASAQSAATASGIEDPFARHAWSLEITSAVAIETWNYNASHEDLYVLEPAFTYGFRDGFMLRAAFPLGYVSQRGVDGMLLGATFGFRARVFHRRRAAVFVELDLGVSKADTFVPPRGTRFNYLALGAAGVTLRLSSGIYAVGTIRWIHLSNNGLAGRDRNPDIEAVGPQLGVMLAF